MALSSRPNNDAPCLPTVSDQTQSRTAAEGDTGRTKQQADSNTPAKCMYQALLLAMSCVSKELSGQQEKKPHQKPAHKNYKQETENKYL